MFYPAVRELDIKKAENMVDEAYEEHHVVKLVLRELPEVDPDAEREARQEELEDLGMRMEQRFDEMTGQRKRRAA
jgi:hypothetical protein